MIIECLVLVVKNFDVKVPQGAKLILTLTSNIGARIAVADFVEIIKTFHKSDFIVNVQYESMVAHGNVKIVTPMVSAWDNLAKCHLTHCCVMLYFRCWKTFFGKKMRMTQL